MAYIIEVDVYTAKVGENEIPNCICALYGLRIVVKSSEEPGVFGSYELA